jgi:hypothetical protein
MIRGDGHIGPAQGVTDARNFRAFARLDELTPGENEIIRLPAYFLRSWSVRSGRTAKLMSFSANRWAYCPSPSFSSQSATCCIAAPCSVRLCARRTSEFTRKIRSREQGSPCRPLLVASRPVAPPARRGHGAGRFSYRRCGRPRRHVSSGTPRP